MSMFPNLSILVSTKPGVPVTELLNCANMVYVESLFTITSLGIAHSLKGKNLLKPTCPILITVWNTRYKNRTDDICFLFGNDQLIGLYQQFRLI